MGIDTVQTLEQLSLTFQTTKEADEDGVAWNAIREHVGAKNAIPAELIRLKLEKVFGRPYTIRRVRAIVARLVEKRKKPIYGSKRAPFGYFVVNNQEEVDAACAELRASAMALLSRAADLKKIGMKEFVDQIRADLVIKEI